MTRLPPLPKNPCDTKHHANLPAVLAGMDQTEVLMFVSLSLNAAEAGALFWGKAPLQAVP